MSKSKGSYSKVEVQKGKIDPAMPTMKTMTNPQRVQERKQEYKEIRDGQTLKLHTPKK